MQKKKYSEGKNDKKGLGEYFEIDENTHPEGRKVQQRALGNQGVPHPAPN